MPALLVPGVPLALTRQKWYAFVALTERHHALAAVPVALCL